MFTDVLSKRVSVALVLAASLFVVPVLALAHGSTVKVTDDSTGKSYYVYYSQVLVYSNGVVSLGASGNNVTVCRGTIVYSDGQNNGYYNYQAIPISSSNAAYSHDGNGASLSHSSQLASCSSSSAGSGGSGGYTGGSGGTEGIFPPFIPGSATLVSHDGGGLITQDAGSLITQDGAGYHQLSVGGRPAVPGSHSPTHFSCSPVVYVPPTGNYYYQAKPTSHLLSAPRGGLYTCQSLAQRIGLTDGGNYR